MWPARTSCCSARAFVDRVRDGRELEEALAREDHEDLLLRGVTVRRAVQLAGRNGDVFEAGANRAGGSAEVPPTRICFDVVEVDDVRAPGARRGKLELALRRLERPRVDRRHLERDAGSHDARSRQPRDRGRRALAEREHVETVGSAIRVCASSPMRWTMQSPARTSKVSPSCHERPDPSSTKKISSSATSMCTGDDCLPGRTRALVTPTSRVPAASPRS